MKELVEYIAKALVDDPDEVKVTGIDGEKTSVIELSVAREHMGRIIGRQGRIAKAVRTILSAAATKKNRRTLLEVIDYQEGWGQ